jgi:hypothetical protein
MLEVKRLKSQINYKSLGTRKQENQNRKSWPMSEEDVS